MSSEQRTPHTADAISGKLPWKRAVYCVQNLQICRTNNLHEKNDLLESSSNVQNTKNTMFGMDFVSSSLLFLFRFIFIPFLLLCYNNNGAIFRYASTPAT